MSFTIKIAVCNSRTDKKYKNVETTWDAVKERCRVPIRTTETVEEYPKLSKLEQDDLKDVGGFVGGFLKGGSRKASDVICRGIGMLDADNIKSGVDFLALAGASLQNTEYFIYSTHRHTPEAPRFRLAILLSRELSADEYPALMRMVAKQMGMELFDDGSYEANRMMYWPSCSSNGEFVFFENKGAPLDPDKYLAMYADWRDNSLLLTSSRQSAVIQRSVKQQQDPLTKDGVVGAFCRAYSIEDVIDTFLPDVYEPSAVSGRYDYIPAESSAGVVLYEGKWAYSHHATDPACNKLLNAFDLVRVHKFGDMDEAKSNNAMRELAVKDERVNTVMLEEKRMDAAREFDDWTKGLQRDRGGPLRNTLHNITLILQNDPALKAVVFNQLADGLEIKGDVPWKHPARFWRDADDAQLISYVDSHYGTFSSSNYQIAVTKVADDRSYHPVREFLDSLPVWDGEKRVDTLLVDYLGAEDNPYVRSVMRKTLCAAIARVNNPGVKFDYMPVLNGPQGIGKSTIIAKLGCDWYTDSVSITDMNDKTAAEKLQGHWIIEIGELAGMKKADIDKVKAFVSRQDDKYRASFGRRVTPHPRQSVFFGTTNSEKGYLRDITGNRRFWTVKTPGSQGKQAWRITGADVRQIWAEALVYYKAGEKLYLPPNLERLAQAEQRDSLEHDEREGIVREYLDRPLPENWDEMSIYDRQHYIRFPDDPTLPEGVTRRDIVSNMEIWCECFSKHKGDIKPADSYVIAAIMERIDNWEKTGKFAYLTNYGKQRTYSRVEQPTYVPPEAVPEVVMCKKP